MDASATDPNQNDNARDEDSDSGSSACRRREALVAAAAAWLGLAPTGAQAQSSAPAAGQASRPAARPPAKTDAKAADAKAADAKTAAKPAKRLKVAGLYTVPAEQQWVSRIDKALKAAAARGEIDYVFSENVPRADYERVLSRYAEAGHALIVGECFAAETLARKVAKDYRKTAFLMGSGRSSQAPNFAVFDNYIQDAAYLTGMLAGGMTQKGRIGMVAGYPVAEVNRLMNAFIAGAREINRDIGFEVGFIDSAFDPPKAKEMAYGMIDEGADVLYAERFGVADAARERKVLAFGNVTNTQSQYPDTLVASALWHVDPTIAAAVAAVRAGKFRGEDYGKYSQMKYGGCELSPLGSFANRVPAELLAQVQARRQTIVDGKFIVKIDDKRPKPPRPKL